jgi:predicted acylesterase/phospholipase RssA
LTHRERTTWSWSPASPGGGSRAAALAHATLAELDEIKFKWNGRETSLTREIDVVTGVSGGSIAAAHLALHGARNGRRSCRVPDLPAFS